MVQIRTGTQQVYVKTELKETRFFDLRDPFEWVNGTNSCQPSNQEYYTPEDSLTVVRLSTWEKFSGGNLYRIFQPLKMVSLLYNYVITGTHGNWTITGTDNSEEAMHQCAINALNCSAALYLSLLPLSWTISRVMKIDGRGGEFSNVNESM